MSNYGGYGNQDPFADAGPAYGAPGPAYGQGSYGQAPHQQASYGHSGSGQTPYGQDSYGPVPYGQPGFGPGPHQPENEGRLFGLLGIGLGLLGFVLAFIAQIYILAGILATIGVILSIASLAKEPHAKGFAITGIIAGSAGIVVFLVQLVLSLIRA